MKGKWTLGCKDTGIEKLRVCGKFLISSESQIQKIVSAANF